MVRSFMTGRLVAFDRIASGLVPIARSACVDLVLELRILGWPQIWISNAMITSPRHHTIALANAIHSVGKRLKPLAFTSI